MKAPRLLIALFLSLPIASQARADGRDEAQLTVARALAANTPRARSKKSFSRMVMPIEPVNQTEMDEEARVDANGRAFFAFHTLGDAAAVAGCVYADTSDVFVARKGAMYPVAFLRGKRVKRAPSGTCVQAERTDTGLSQVFAVPPPRVARGH